MLKKLCHAFAFSRKPPPGSAVRKVWHHQRIGGEMNGHNAVDKVEHVRRAWLGVGFPCKSVAKNVAANHDCNEIASPFPLSVWSVVQLFLGLLEAVRHLGPRAGNIATDQGRFPAPWPSPAHNPENRNKAQEAFKRRRPFLFPFKRGNNLTDEDGCES